MKILHINCSDVGSTGKIIADIAAECAGRGHETHLCAPSDSGAQRHAAVHAVCTRRERGIYRRVAYLLGYQYGFSPLPTARILSTLRRVRPDLVHIHSANCSMVNIYKLLSYLKRKDIATVVTNHAEFFYTGSCEHAYPCEKWLTGCGGCPNGKRACRAMRDTTAAAHKKMKRAFSGFPRICVSSVSPYVYSRSVRSPILEGLVQTVVKNGVNTGIFSYRPEREARARLGIAEGERVVLAVTAFFSPTDKDKKGGYYLLELARRMPSVRFIVAGVYTAAEGVTLPENLTVLGSVREQSTLADYYAAADACVSTSRRETFGMTVAESLCVGTPVVGFFAGGPESIALTEYTEFVDFGDTGALVSLLENRWLGEKRRAGAENISRAACHEYDGKIMARKYREIYEKVVKYESGNTDVS